MLSFPGVNNKGSTVWTTKPTMEKMVASVYGKCDCKVAQPWKVNWLAGKSPCSIGIHRLKWWIFHFHLESSWWFQPIWNIHISQNGNLPQIGMNIKLFWNHHLIMLSFGKVIHLSVQRRFFADHFQEWKPYSIPSFCRWVLYICLCRRKIQ